MRQLLNLIYMHLRPPHHPDCGLECDRACPREAFHQQLEAPLTRRDQQMHERIRQRREALWRGEIPA